MTDDDGVIIMCVEWGTHSVPSVQLPCSTDGCDTQVALSIDMQRAEPAADVICTTCAQREHGMAPGAGVHPAQRELLESMYGKEVVDAMDRMTKGVPLVELDLAPKERGDGRATA
jgi:hypothetical protein